MSAIAVAIAPLVIVGLSALVLFLLYQSRSLRAEQRRERERLVEQKRQAAELTEIARRAESVNVAKSELLASVSHEMRTPLHGIIGMLQLAGDSEPSIERRLQLEMASRSAKSLLATIEDILDFTRIEARKLELEPVYFSARELVADTMKTLGVTAAQKGLQIAFRVAPEVPDRLWGDPMRLRQIVINLVGNAIKFTDRGEIVLRAWAEEISSSETMFHIEVRDTGIGIDEHRKVSIFDPFGRSDSSDSLRHGGAGLGLSIVAQLVKAMDGMVTVQSEPGKGSTFHAAVRLAYDAIAGVFPGEWERSLAGLRALIVEPHAATREILSEILATHGMTAESYESVADALQPSIREAFSCVIIDAVTLASTPWISPVPIVQIVSPLSGMIVPAVTVTRPVGDRELIDAVAVAMGVVERRMSFTLERRVDGDRPRSVLVADDHPVNLEFAAEALRRLGHTIATASSGVEALRLLQSRAFDVAFVDVQMPEMDGLEVTRRLRAVERGRHTTVIALTAQANEDERQRCLQAGMDSVLTKPLTQNRLASALRGQSPKPESDMILESVGGNLKLLMRVHDAFIQQSPRLLASMRNAIAQRNPDELYKSAHTLKGAISNFGMGEALEVAIGIERAGKDADLESAAVLLPRLEASVRELQERMSAVLAAATQTAAQG